MARRTIVAMPGDGIGKTVLPEAIRVLSAAGFEADYVNGDIGWDFWIKEGNALPQRTIDLIEKEHVFFLSNYVGTPTLTRALPVIKRFGDVILVGNFTGAQPQREVPYVEHVFNIRASYRQEMVALVERFWQQGARRFRTRHSGRHQRVRTRPREQIRRRVRVVRPGDLRYLNTDSKPDRGGAAVLPRRGPGARRRPSLDQSVAGVQEAGG